MSSVEKNVGDLNSAIRDMRWDEVRRITRSNPQLINERYITIDIVGQLSDEDFRRLGFFDELGVTSLYTIVLAKAPQNLIFEVLEFAKKEVIDDVNLEAVGRSILYYLASYGYVDALRRALEISNKCVNWQSEGCNTPLHVLLQGKHSFSIHFHAIQILLDAGADIKLKNKRGLTPIDVYVQNRCEEYDNTNEQKQKEDILQLLYSVAVPGVVVARGKEALSVFNKELEEKGQITVNHAQLLVTGDLECIVKTLMPDLKQMFNEEEAIDDDIVCTTAFTIEDYCSDCKVKESIDEYDGIKQKSNNELKANVAKKRKLHTSYPISTTAKTQPTTTLEPMETERSRGLLWVNESCETLTHGRVSASEQILTDLISPHVSKAVPSSSEYAEVLIPFEKEQIGAIGNEDITYISDFRGQQLHYTPPNVMKSEAVYLIGFNLMEEMHAKKKCRVSRMAKVAMTYDMTNLQIITHRMEFIFTYAVNVEQQRLKAKKPKIVVVGTLQGSDEEKQQQQQQIAEKFKMIFQEIKGTPYEHYVVRNIYVIDNESPSGSEMLKTLEEDICGFLKAMTNTIPVTWHALQLRLQEMDRETVHVQYDKVQKIATECGILEWDLIHTLNYLHDLGIVMYFEYNTQLKDKVVINPQKVNNITEKLITAVKTDDEMVQFWDKFDEEGILEERLVKHIWKEELSKDETNVCLEVMKECGLMCEQKQNQEKASRSFFVPCRLKYSEDKMTIAPDNDQTVSIYITSDGLLFDGIFHRIVVSLIRMVQAKGYAAMPKLYQSKATIDLGYDHTLSLGQVIIENKLSLKENRQKERQREYLTSLGELEISRKSEILEDGKPTDTGRGEPSPGVCRQVLGYFDKELKALISRMKGTSYMFRVLCWSGLQEMHFHNMEECLRNNHIPCGKKLIGTSKLQKLFKTDDIHVYLPDRILLLISEGLGEKWKQVGVRLGFSWSKINQISSYCCKRQSDCTMEMLTEWRSLQKYETNQAKIMGNVLKDQGLKPLAKSALIASQPYVTSGGKRTEHSLYRPHQKYDGQLSDIDMLFIANEIDEDWQSLGTHLGMKLSEIKRIKIDFAPSSVDAILEMLVRWRGKQEANENHLEKISAVLNKLEKFSTVQEIQTYYHDKYY